MGQRAMSWSQMPGPIQIPFLGELLGMARDPLQSFLELHREHGDYVRLRLGPYNYVVINDPEAIRQMLVKEHGKFVKSKNYIALRLLLEDGLITSEGDVWRRKRKLVQPSVHPQKLSHFYGVIDECTQDLMASWSKRSGMLDIHEEMMRLTFRIIGFIVVSEDLEGRAREMGEALDYLLKFADQYTGTLLRFLPVWLPLRPFRKMRYYTRRVEDIALPIIEERRRMRARGESRHDDLLERLLAAREDDEQPLTDRELKAEILTMVAAGHETTANALTWTFYLLSQNPEAANKLREEVDRVFEGGGLSYERLEELEYTDCVLREAMRIYPAVWVIERDSLEDIELGGYRIPKGTTFAVSPWTLHRHPRYWDAPGSFRPERFLPEASKDRPRHVYLPFGTGPRVCVGAALAMMEAKIILASIVRRFHVSLSPEHRLSFEPSITLRPGHGMKMKASPRQLE